ncbi:hypothetical protein VNO78_28816 [Psophocarpus tetragonolobus]|uniref:Uncharacterized protein n=1 Tax=Psophocarpus tetragonolobus TaxID=3891 RepID=A0AAN9WZ96_PSOTE
MMLPLCPNLCITNLWTPFSNPLRAIIMRLSVSPLCALYPINSPKLVFMTAPNSNRASHKSFHPTMHFNSYVTNRIDTITITHLFPASHYAYLGSLRTNFTFHTQRRLRPMSHGCNNILDDLDDIKEGGEHARNVEEAKEDGKMGSLENKD